MSNTLGNPTAVSTKSREGQVASYNASLTSAPSIANPLVRIRAGSTTLVDHPLNATTPMTVGAEDGSVAFNYLAPSAVAVGGLGAIADNYQIIGRDAVVHLSGVAVFTDPITAGQIVDADVATLTAPAS